MYSKVIAGAVHAMNSCLLQVEVDISDGLPSFSIVGFVSGEVREAGERVRVALKNYGIHLPPRRITVNLSPAEIPKRGIVIDLPVCVGLMVCLGILPENATDDIVIAGELGLNGEIRPVRGILSIVMEAKRQGYGTCIVPEANLREGAVVQDIKVIGVSSLDQLYDYLISPPEERDGIIAPLSIDVDHLLSKEPLPSSLDFASVRGHTQVKKVMEIAAAGFHNVLLVGAPGSGKSMLAKCMPGIMPPLTPREAVEITQIYSVAGLLEEGKSLITQRPFVAPHHSATRAALVGGGSIPSPGLISLAHLGILFLDELPEFASAEIELLRQPLEDHEITIHRVQGSYRFPARMLLVAAANPCPCGYYPDANRCRCTPYQVRNYQRKLSGPLLDRFDFSVGVQRVEAGVLQGAEHEETSAQIRGRVTMAAERQQHRFAGTKFLFNGDMDADAVQYFCRLDSRQERLMQMLYEQMQMSARSYHKILKMARTIADLEDRDKILERDLMMAASYRVPEGRNDNEEGGQSIRMLAGPDRWDRRGDDRSAAQTRAGRGGDLSNAASGHANDPASGVKAPLIRRQGGTFD